MMPHDSGYGTQSEKRFLNELGNGVHSENVRVQQCSRAELLRRYLQAAQERVDWCSMDKAEVLKHAQDLLAQCGRGGVHGALL
jgi:hypothetical protein